MCRCDWAKSDLEKEYHDHEWGRPIHDDNLLFEMLILEGQQAGLSWLTILKKRQHIKQAFDNFDIHKISKYNQSNIDILMQNPNIIRNKLKIKCAINNAKAFLNVQKTYGSFDKFIWSYTENKPIVNHWECHKDVPTDTTLSLQISKDLKKVGFTFVGSIIIYSYMQSIGLVNDHIKTCFLYGKKIDR